MPGSLHVLIHTLGARIQDGINAACLVFHAQTQAEHGLQDKLQAAGRTFALSMMLPVHSLTGFNMVCKGCQGQQLQIDAGSSMSLVKGFGHKGCTYKSNS